MARTKVTTFLRHSNAGGGPDVMKASGVCKVGRRSSITLLRSEARHWHKM